MTSEDINKELERRGIPFDPESHWKTRESLLKQARELDPPSNENADIKTNPAPAVDSANPPVIEDNLLVSPAGNFTDTANFDGEVVITTNPPKTLPTIGMETGVFPKIEKEPTGRASMGDKDPEVIEWRRQNWSAEQFKAKYPNA